nr:MAG TPA: hypothetical protein [Caudoviricetes sp.]
MGRKTRHILIFQNGREIPVTGVTRQHYVTREGAYRKKDPTISGIRQATELECEDLTDRLEKRGRWRR